MNAEQKQQKMLVLHIAVPEIWADDLEEYAGYYSEPDPPGPDDRLHVVTEEWFRPDCVVTLATIPGEKCQNHEWEIIGRDARIVGAELRDRKLA